MMTEEIRECYRHLELRPGAPPEDIKKSFHDLVKVWHPDRFAHDPVLQQRAQEKLKEINLAYEKLRALAESEELDSDWESETTPRKSVGRTKLGVLEDRDPLTSRLILVGSGTVALAIFLGVAYFAHQANPPPAMPEPTLVKRFQGKGFGLDPKPTESVPEKPAEKQEKEAEIGDAKAQFALGLRYENGDGVLIDKRQAVHWYQAAATNGLAAAQNRMGEFYLRGKVVDEDFVEAARWFRKAAEQGNPEGQCQLGSLFAEGRGVPQSFVTATEWYRKAAEQGYAKAQFELGLLNASGKQLPQNLTEALKWYQLAAQQGNADAQYRLGELYKKGEGVQPDKIEAYKWYNLATTGDAPYAEQSRDQLMKSMSPQEVLEGQKRSSEFKPVVTRR